MKSKSFKLFVVGSFLAASAAVAAPPNTVVLDGRPLEYDAVDLRGFNPNPNNSFGLGNVITNLYVTWDANYIYFALQGWEVNDKLTIMIDADPGAGTGATATTNWTGVTPDYIRYNDVGWRKSDDISSSDFGLDYMIASEGFYNNVIRILYNGIEVPGTNNTQSLLDSGNGSTPTGGSVDMVVRADGTISDLKGIEARVAWSQFYPSSGVFGVVSGGEVVPQGAMIRVFAVLHNNDPASSFSSDGIIPSQTSVNASFAAGIWTSDDYVDVIIDGDTNGIPDVAVGDVNAPYLKFVSGVQGKRQVFAWFNETVASNTADISANWRVDGNTPDSVTVVQSDAVLLNLTNDLPANGSLVRVEASGVEDAASNSKTTYNFFDPAASGIETSITVRFLLNKNSGMGFSSANPRATTNLFVNGASAPLEWGYPPAKSSPLIMLNSTQYYRDVTFPPGTATRISYKYSGVLDGGGLATGTNNYEAIRLVNYTDASRQLTLPTNGITSLVVTDWLGAAAAPYRDPNTNSGYNALYIDARRGDAGVRKRTTMLFQLDLTQRNRQGITRVMVQGSDPLRGFNSDNAGVADFAAGGAVGWDIGGVELVDDGTLGDEAADDGIYSRLWAFTTDGIDAAIVPEEFPGDATSLVGGNFSTSPYNGSWLDRRSPRSIVYKYYIYKAGSDEALESPSSNIEIYLEDTAPTNVVLEPFVWDNASLPLPPPSNAPTLITVSNLGGVGYAQFENDVTELQHGFLISSNPINGWNDYGSRAVTTVVAGVWQIRADGAGSNENYAAFAGPPKPFEGVFVDPYPIPATGGNMRIYYTQHSRGLAGDRNVQIAGNWTVAWTPSPMTFLGDGVWYYDLVTTTSLFPNTLIKFKPRNLSGSFWDGMGGGGNDFFLYLGDLRASYSSTSPTNDELFTITYNAFGGPLSAASNVNAYVGFDEQWYNAGGRPMTNTLGNTNVWEITFPIPTSATLSVNFVFNGQVAGGSVSWDSEGSTPPNGRQWRIFLDQAQ